MVVLLLTMVVETGSILVALGFTITIRQHVRFMVIIPILWTSVNGSTCPPIPQISSPCLHHRLLQIIPRLVILQCGTLTQEQQII